MNEYREQIQAYEYVRSRFSKLVWDGSSEDVPESGLIFFLTKLNQVFPSIMAIEHRSEMRKMSRYIAGLIDSNYRPVGTGRERALGQSFSGDLPFGRKVQVREGLSENVLNDVRSYEGPVMTLTNVEKMADAIEARGTIV